ncbi:FAD-dependent oxidoreductase, partial [bacterium]|nr:FAD-dependent oxidoreductase [bacterium]
RLDENANIVLFERGPDVSFANCGMPYYLGGEITSRDKMLVAKPELLRGRFRIDVRVCAEVTRIDRANKEITWRDVNTKSERNESYDFLILSPGASPIRPPIPGVDLPFVHVLRSLADMDQIRSRIDLGAKRVLVVGAGFIGLEVAESLTHLGIKVTVVELQDQVLPPLDAEMTTPIAQTLMKNGVELILSDSAARFEDAGTGGSVVLTSGRRIETDMVLLGVGVRPDNGLAKEAGLELGTRGGIKVDRHMRTNDPFVYAVGDAVETVDFVTGQPTQVPLAGPANRQGRIAADNILGIATEYRGTQGTAIVRVFDRVAALTGQSEKLLLRAAKPFRKIYVHPAHHASYYPGAEQMTLKLLFDEADGRVLGAQAVGGAGVDKRIDVLAMAIQAKMTVYDLEEAELCYAPPFGSAKDPVNMAGFVAANLLRGIHPQTVAENYSPEHSPQGQFVIDVRTAREFAEGHLPEAINIPVDELRDRLAEIRHDQPITVYCQVGQRGYLATRILQQQGYRVSNVSGGYKTYCLYHTE